MPDVLGVIPARYASTRFPGKPLAPLGERSLVEEVWRRASASARLSRVVVATEDRRIVERCRHFGADVMLTAASHASGTDRVAEVVERLDSSFDVVVNIQGDEPLLTPTSLERLLDALDRSGSPEMATLAEPILTVEELFDPNVVKVVTARDRRALYFSRSPIPYHRGTAASLACDFRDAVSQRPDALAEYLRHQGIYAYRRAALLELTRMEPSALERLEGLEQLRALEAGYSIVVADSDFRSQAVDTPADLDRVARILTEAR